MFIFRPPEGIFLLDREIMLHTFVRGSCLFGI